VNRPAPAPPASYQDWGVGGADGQAGSNTLGTRLAHWVCSIHLKVEPMKTLLKSALPLVAAAFLIACGGSDDNFDDRADVADPKVRFIHAVPLGPTLTLSRNDIARPEASDTSYKFASRYFDVETGQATWPVRSGSARLDEATFDARRGNKYTIVALPGSSGVELLLIDDPYSKGITSNDARVRVVNASLNAQSVDVYLTAANADIAVTGPTLGAVAYQTAQPASGNDSAQLEGGDYRLRITAAGSKAVIFDAAVVLARNADWLLLTIPAGVTPGDVNVLLVQSDIDTQTAVEIPGR
jgi:hypothetical protein